MTDLCHCGKPLHYSSKMVENVVNEIIKAKGTRFVEIEQVETGNKYKVDIHYIALHGLNACDLDSLGFEVKDEG